MFGLPYSVEAAAYMYCVNMCENSERQSNIEMNEWINKIFRKTCACFVIVGGRWRPDGKTKSPTMKWIKSYKKSTACEWNNTKIGVRYTENLHADV